MRPPRQAEPPDPFVLASASVFRNPWAVSSHPEEFILLVLHTFIWKERDPFSKQSLNICCLDRSPLQCSGSPLSPLPSHHCLACLQEWVGRACSHRTVWGSFGIRKVLTSGVRICLPSFPQVDLGSVPWTHSSYSHLQLCLLPCRIALQKLCQG